MKAYVVDTNVLVGAEGLCDTASPQCARACRQHLKDLRAFGVLLVDDLGLIASEYSTNLHQGRQGRTGWAFYKWLRAHGGTRARYVQITPIPGPAEDYEEFPRDEALRGFDRSDRKFVAVALASGLNPPIVNATDTDWAIYHSALADAGVTVQFLCPDDCAPVPWPE